MSRIMKAIQAYCTNTVASPYRVDRLPPLSEMNRAVFLGDRLGWTDEQMREVDSEARNSRNG